MSADNVETFLKNADSDIESSKGYWTDDTNGYLNIAVLQSSAIVLSSCYWYRVQIFQLPNSNDEKETECWNYVKQLLRECGRSLPASEDGIYRLTNLSLQQANQIYYLLKHNLTSAKAEFQLHYGLFIDSAKTVKTTFVKGKKRRLRSKKGKIIVPANEWQS